MSRVTQEFLSPASQQPKLGLWDIVYLAREYRHAEIGSAPRKVSRNRLANADQAVVSCLSSHSGRIAG